MKHEKITHSIVAIFVALMNGDIKSCKSSSSLFVVLRTILNNMYTATWTSQVLQTVVSLTLWSISTYLDVRYIVLSFTYLTIMEYIVNPVCVHSEKNQWCTNSYTWANKLKKKHPDISCLRIQVNVWLFTTYRITSNVYMCVTIYNL